MNTDVTAWEAFWMMGRGLRSTEAMENASFQESGIDDSDAYMEGLFESPQTAHSLVSRQTG